MATTTTTLTKTYQDKADAQRQALPAALAQTMGGIMPQIPALLPPDIPTEQFRSALYLELTGRPELQDCTMDSLRDGVIKAAMLGLLLGRDCHLLPFRGRKAGQRLATFVPNYFGLLLALERTGKVAKAFAHPVYQGDDFAVDYLADVYRHIPAVARGKKPGALKFFYGCVRMKDGTTHIEVMDESQIDAVKRRSPAHEHGPWVDDYLMMARKTVLKRVIKYVRVTPEVRQMLDDETVREQEDIPAARHQRNITDLFGEGGDPTAPALAVRATYAVDPATGELQDAAGTPRETRPATAPARPGGTSPVAAEEPEGAGSSGPSWGPESPDLLQQEEEDDPSLFGGDN